MECQLRSMADGASVGSGGPDDPSPAESGRVGKVCREWLVREDGVMAYKLQHEEIEQHYDHNRFKNRAVRTDIPVAKTLQQGEEEEAEMARQAYERMLLEQEEADAEIAYRLQEQLSREETRRQQSTEQEDQRLAFQLQEKERLRLERKKKEKELERERRQVEYVHSMQVSEGGSDAGTGNGAEAFSPDVVPLRKSDDVDLSEFMLEPPLGLSETELKRFLEDQDAELAKLLQEQESKVKTERRGQSFRDRQMAIEAQDRELARVLQEQERARVKRAKEKARQKALQLQQQKDMERIEEAQPGGGECKPKLRRDFDSNRSSDGSEGDLAESDLCSGTGSGNNSGHSNVAMILDPTYSRHHNNGHSQAPHRNSPSSKDSLERPPMLHNRSPGHSLSAGSSVDNSNTASPMKSPSQSSAGSSPLLETLRHDYLEGLQDDDDPVPPYMPIQGQRRLGSLDKPKKKKNKEACKMQ